MAFGLSGCGRGWFLSKLGTDDLFDKCSQPYQGCDCLIVEDLMQFVRPKAGRISFEIVLGWRWAC